MTQYSFFVTTLKNSEELLLDELNSLGIPGLKQARGGVSFTASLAMAYRVCLWSRLANRVLLSLHTFAVDSPETLYREIQTVNWSEHLASDASLAVDCKLARSTMTHSHFVSLKTKDAIVDQFRHSCGQRPSVDTLAPSLRLNLYIYRDEATLSLDLSGDSLHRRGYRQEGGAAPLKENLAALLLLRAGWPGIAREGRPLVDPMCGSGTLLIEAALMAGDIAPGLLRSYWGFTGWQQHDEAAWQALLEEARQRRSVGLESIPPICGYDHHPVAIRSAEANLERAGLSNHVSIVQCELGQLPAASSGTAGLFITNPPYGERLGEDSELPALYAKLGEVMRTRYQGWHAAIFTGNPPLVQQFGLRSKKRHQLYNGAIECKLYQYELLPENFVSLHAGPAPLPVEQRSEGAEMFANRLKKNLRNLGRWAKQNHVNCYRLYDADMPEYAVAIDLYYAERLYVVVQEYEAPRSVDEKKARQRLREAMGVIREILQLEESQLSFKVRKRQKGAAQYQRLGLQQEFHEVMENGLRFLVNFTDYLDTGLFLDHRITRSLVRDYAHSQEFLNLFAYTGSATVYAAQGGAVKTTTVDMSRTYLDWAQRNMRLNGFTGKNHQYEQSDCLSWLQQAVKSRQRYGLIFLDPPSFSTSKRMSETFDIQRDHIDLIKNTAKLLTMNGRLIFSTNLRKFRMQYDAFNDYNIEDITSKTIPKDFTSNSRIHQCFLISRKP